jgi:hypothetical protein
VITGDHCLPRLPSPLPRGPGGPQDNIYASLIGPLHEQPTIWATCDFVDPVADVAVFGAPNVEGVEGEEWEAYLTLTDDVPTIPIGETPKSGIAWLLTLAEQNTSLNWLIGRLRP